MAERRMFAKSIVLSDAFLDMPMSARCLYFTLGMLADDDGFVGGAKSIMRQCGASQDDMAILLSKRYVLGFASGVIVIKHWRMNNYLQNDRHKKTTYLEELKTLEIDDKGAYTESKKEVYTNCIQDVYTGKVSIDKTNKKKEDIPKGISKKEKKFIKPTIEEIEAYCKERNNSINPTTFYNFYEAKDWMIGKNHMKDWQACVRTWEGNELNRKGKPSRITIKAPVYKQNPEVEEKYAGKSNDEIKAEFAEMQKRMNGK